MIFELASLSASDLDTIRAEITHALEVEGGWNKPALARFYKIDSMLREVGRHLGCRKSATRSGSHLPYQPQNNIPSYHSLSPLPSHPNPTYTQQSPCSA